MYQIDRVESTTIDWKEGKDMSKELQQKKQKNKKTGSTRTVEKLVDCDTIFTCFQTFKPFNFYDDDQDEEDYEMTKDEQKFLAQGENCAEFVKAVRNTYESALSYFLGHVPDSGTGNYNDLTDEQME